MHVLLRKRDVRGAIGWIGLVWLSPGLGVVMYYVFGVNRVIRRATRLRRRVGPGKALVAPSPAAATPATPNLPDNIATIARLGARITGQLLAPGNALSILHAGDEGYPAMLEAIGGARRSVALLSYIFRDDDIGNAFVAALREAQSRGVEIRVLIDGVGGGYWIAPIARRLADAKIPVARFMNYQLPWRMPFLNMRNHKKLLIVDGRCGFTGGLNLGAENVLADSPRNPVNDVHFRVEGPVVKQLMISFAEDWSFTTGEVLEGYLWWPEIPVAGEMLARGITSGPDEDIGALATIVATAVGQATRRLRIVSPYFLPDQSLSNYISLAALRGVQIDIVVPQRSDHILMDWAMHAHLAFLQTRGIHLHFSPAPFDHSKLTTVDDSWALIGSANWDVRSFRLNFEFTLECYDRKAVGDIDRLIDEKISAGRRIGADEFGKRPLAIQLRDAAARLMIPYF